MRTLVHCILAVVLVTSAFAQPTKAPNADALTPQGGLKKTDTAEKKPASLSGQVVTEKQEKQTAPKPTTSPVTKPTTRPRATAPAKVTAPAKPNAPAKTPAPTKAPPPAKATGSTKPTGPT